MSPMIRRSGLLVSFFAAAVLAAVPSGAARADVAPPAPMDGDVATPGTRTARDGAGGLAAKLVRAGMPAGEAEVLVAGLAPEERELLAERAEGAEVGGFAPLVPLVPFFIVFGIIVGVMAIFGTLDAADTDDAPEPGPSPEPEQPEGPSPEQPEGPPGDLARHQES